MFLYTFICNFGVLYIISFLYNLVLIEFFRTNSLDVYLMRMGIWGKATREKLESIW